MLKHIPNTLTIIRILLIPLILFFIIQENYIATMIVLIISGVTDVADGFIARNFNLITDFGKLADPLADKLTQISLLIAIVAKHIIPLWILAVFIIKEFLLICGSAFLYGKNLVVSSKWYGKLTTVILYFAIFCSILIRQFELGEIFITINNITYYIATFFTVLSLILYCKEFMSKDLLKREN